MERDRLDTGIEKTWCPSCTNFMLLESVKRAIGELIKKGKKQEDFAIVTGIGCHAKIYDYLNLAGVYGLHGRVLPTAFGIKIGNPNLSVIGFAGDGDMYAEGISHLVHASRYNSDMTLIVHDNQVFALTTGQASPTSQLGFKDRTAFGVLTRPLNPVRLALAAGACFVARINSMDIEHSSKIIEKAIQHKGFSFIEALQPCIVFHDVRELVRKNSYKLEEIKYDKTDIKRAMEKAGEFDYSFRKNLKIPFGIFYQEKRQTFEQSQPQLNALLEKKEVWWQVNRKPYLKKLLI